MALTTSPPVKMRQRKALQILSRKLSRGLDFSVNRNKHSQVLCNIMIVIIYCRECCVNESGKVCVYLWAMVTNGQYIALIFLLVVGGVQCGRV